MEIKTEKEYKAQQIIDDFNERVKKSSEKILEIKQDSGEERIQELVDMHQNFLDLLSVITSMITKRNVQIKYKLSTKAGCDGGEPCIDADYTKTYQFSNKRKLK